MPTTKSQSPGPNPTTPTTSRKPRNKVQEVEKSGAGAGRAGSAGGIVLDKESVGKKKSTVNMSSTTATKAASPAVNATGSTGKDAAGPNRQRRRPRKLNKEPLPQEGADGKATAATTAGKEPPAASTTELESLKSRVRGLEAKVEELYQSGAIDARTGRSPRRRGKGRKPFTTTQQGAVPTPSAVQVENEPEQEEEADEELGRLEDELEVARRDLESYRPRNRRTTSDETEYIEEIPRGEGVAVDDTYDTSDRQITLTGSYRIPLPNSVSMKDVKKIQGGVSAAQNVARNFLEQRRAQQGVQDATPAPTSTSTRAKTSSTATPKSTKKPSTPTPSTSTALSKEVGGKESWSEWFGGYSMAISRAVKNIEAETAIEAQRSGTTGGGPSTSRPKQASRTASAPAAKTTGKSMAAKTPAKTSQRPPARSKAGGLSSDQVKGLMG